MNNQPISRRRGLIPGLGLLLGALLTTAAIAQEVLPFPPTPSASKAGLTMQDSTYKKRVEPRRLADGAPNILIILMDDVGFFFNPTTVSIRRPCARRRGPRY